MNEWDRRLTERVAAGLQALPRGVTPDYFVFIYQEGWTWDLPEMLGIPVVHVPRNVNYCPYGDSDLPFVPAWREELTPQQTRSVHAFEKAYDNT
jgi:hypothetical protein